MLEPIRFPLLGRQPRCGLVDALHPCNGLSPERKPTIENVGAQRQEIPPVNTIVLVGNLTKNPDLRHTTQRATSVTHLTTSTRVSDIMMK